MLLREALQRAAFTRAQLAVRTIVVHPIDYQAASFYERCGFRALSSAPRAR
ncbi:MAG: hypothetical protein M0T77_09480 [Actinomycetota bacterium]|nr:hypothetical protein [Actinomycetota bacterium]